MYRKTIATFAAVVMLTLTVTAYACPPSDDNGNPVPTTVPSDDAGNPLPCQP